MRCYHGCAAAVTAASVPRAQVGESPVYSKPVAVDLAALFKPAYLNVGGVQAMTLSMNAPTGSNATAVALQPHDILSWIVTP